MKSSLFLPIAVFFLIVLFFACLPALPVCHRPKLLPDKTRGWQRHWFLLALTLVYTAVAFVRLGDTHAPQTFRRFDGGCAVLTLETPAEIGSVMLYTGIGQGSVTVEFSADGRTWLPAATHTLDHVALLKWEAPDLSHAPGGVMQAVRVTGYSGAELGEAALFSPAGEQLALHSDCTELCDEQQLVPETQTFLNSSYFDEIYHARTAWEHLRRIYPYEISHPPLGKELISLGILLFGMTPFGWRFSGTLFGAAMLPLIYWFARRLYGGRIVPGCCAALLAFDFMHFAQTRIATIDTFAVFFILLMYGFMLGWLRDGNRRDLALSGLFFGLGAASKWTCLYAGAGLGLLWLSVWLGRLRALTPEGKAAGEKQDMPRLGRAFLQNVGWCLLFFVAVPALIYYLAYLPYGLSRQCLPFSAAYTKIFWDNQVFMLTYHKGVTATHPYSSRWYQWVLDIRPILFYYKGLSDGRRSSFGSWLNPVLCWAGLLSLFVLLYMALVRRDRKAGFLLLGYLAQLVPWMFITRITFEYHYFPCSVFLVLSLGYVFALMRDNLRAWRWPVYGLCGLQAAVFLLFYPALSGAPISNELASRLLKWLPTWPF